MTRPLVLVVDDEPAILTSTQLLLDELGFEAITTHDPSAVVPTLRDRRPQVLLQDVRMPGLDLAKLVATIRSDPVIGATPILLFSASMDLDDVANAVGATARLEKPFRPSDLARSIQRVLAV